MGDAVDLVKVGSLCVGAIGLFVAIYQIRRTIKWNQVNAALIYFDAARVAALEEHATAELRRLKIEFELDGTQLTAEQAKQIIADPVAYTKTKYLLNMLECNAAAINAGAIHEQFAFHQMGYYYLRNRAFFGELMRQARGIKHNSRCWQEFDVLCHRWERWRRRGEHAALSRIV